MKFLQQIDVKEVLTVDWCKRSSYSRLM